MQAHGTVRSISHVLCHWLVNMQTHPETSWHRPKHQTIGRVGAVEAHRWRLRRISFVQFYILFFRNSLWLYIKGCHCMNTKQINYHYIHIQATFWQHWVQFEFSCWNYVITQLLICRESVANLMPAIQITNIIRNHGHNKVHIDTNNCTALQYIFLQCSHISHGWCTVVAGTVIS